MLPRFMCPRESKFLMFSSQLERSTSKLSHFIGKLSPALCVESNVTVRHSAERSPALWENLH